MFRLLSQITCLLFWKEKERSNVHEWQKDVNASGKLSKNAIVHFWKGDAKLIKEAVEKGYKVVNSTHSFTYLDYDYKSISLEKAYMFNPVTEGIADKDKGNIIGLGCQMWAEWIPTVDAMYKQIFPRAAAYAETGWTNHENKNFTRFQSSLEEQKLRWKKAGIPFHE
jgi:hexosaminidase